MVGPTSDSEMQNHCPGQTVRPTAFLASIHSITIPIRGGRSGSSGKYAKRIGKSYSPIPQRRCPSDAYWIFGPILSDVRMYDKSEMTSLFGSSGFEPIASRDVGSWGFVGSARAL